MASSNGPTATNSLNEVMLESRTGELLGRVFGELNRLGITLPLSRLFNGLSKSFECFIKGKDELQKYLTPFLFDGHDQRVDISVSRDTGLKFTPDVTTSIHETVFNTSKLPGELESHIVFKTDEEHSRANTLHGKVLFGGMPCIHFVVDVARALISSASRTDTPKLRQGPLLEALNKVFPQTRNELEKFIDIQDTSINIEYITPSENPVGAVVLCLNASIDMKLLKKHYPSVENLLSHVKLVEFGLLDGSELPVFQNKAGPRDEEFNNHVEKAAEEAPEVLRVALEAQKNVCFIKIVICLRQDSDELLYMQKGSEMPLLEDDEQGQRVFRTVEFDMEEESRFLVLLNLRAKILELGCATLSLPTLYIEFLYKGRLQNHVEQFEAHLLHMGTQRRAVRFVLKPFINIDTFRWLLMSTLRITFSVVPNPEPEEEGEKEKVGEFNVTFFLTLLRPRSAVAKCMSFFLRHQLSRLDIVDLLYNIFTALGKDLEDFSKSEIGSA